MNRFSPLPDVGFIRLKQIVGDLNASPPVPPIIPVSKATWWAGVKTGRYPKPVKLGPRITAWHVDDIKKLIDQGRSLHEEQELPSIKTGGLELRLRCALEEWKSDLESQIDIGKFDRSLSRKLDAVTVLLESL